MFLKFCSLQRFYFQNDRTIQGQADFHDFCFSPLRLICLVALAGLLIHCCALVIGEKYPFAHMTKVWNNECLHYWQSSEKERF